MKTMSIVIVCIVLFIVSGIIAYVAETVLLRSKGKMKRDDSLIRYYRAAEQKEGNKIVITWTAIWLILMVISVVIIYFVY